MWLTLLTRALHQVRTSLYFLQMFLICFRCFSHCLPSDLGKWLVILLASVSSSPDKGVNVDNSFALISRSLWVLTTFHPHPFWGPLIYCPWLGFLSIMFVCVCGEVYSFKERLLIFHIAWDFRVFFGYHPSEALLSLLKMALFSKSLS